LAGGVFMDKILEQSLLYDFYGEMLTPHQKAIYEEFVLNDLSLGEIAAEREISRQGVYDIIKRCKAQLGIYEEKLHLIEKFSYTKKKAEEISRYAVRIRENCHNEDSIAEYTKHIMRISDEIIEDF
jgi:uncharacterized protein